MVVDATFLASSRRIEFYEACVEAGLSPFFVYCFADVGILRERVRKRMAEGADVSDGHISVLERQLQAAEAPDELPFFRVLKLNTGDDEAAGIRKALRLFL